MRWIPLALLIALACAPGAALAQAPARLTALVTDDLNAPLDGVLILVGDRYRSLTNATGRAVIEGIAPGQHLVQIRRLGYRVEQAVVDFAPGAVVELETALEVLPLELEGVEVTAERFDLRLAARGFYARRQQGLGSFLDREYFDRYRHLPDLQLALRHLRGFSVSPSRNGTGFTIRSARGAASIMGRCTPQIFLDGMPSDAGMLNALAPIHIEAIEAYAGPATTPAEFLLGESASCGTIVVWTRNR